MEKIVVIGSANMDFVMKIPNLPQVGETVTDGLLTQAFGGKGANQAVSAAQAGGEVWFLACVGDDDLGSQMKQNLQQRGVHTDYVATSGENATGAALIMVGAGGENMIAVAPGANYDLTPTKLLPLEWLIADAALVILQYELLPGTVQAVLEMAAKHQRQVLFNCAPARPLPEALQPHITYLVVNESEAAFLCGFPVQTTDQVEQAADVLLENGVKTVLITLGAEGVYVATTQERKHVPAFPVTAVDSTGAGDVFCGCLGVGLVAGWPLLAAVRFANAGAAISVTRLGAQPSIPSREEIELMLQRQS